MPYDCYCDNVIGKMRAQRRTVFPQLRKLLTNYKHTIINHVVTGGRERGGFYIILYIYYDSAARFLHHHHYSYYNLMGQNHWLNRNGLNK